MIFYYGDNVNWKQGAKAEKGTPEREVYEGINEIKEKFFGDDKKGFVQLRYPNGVRQKNNHSDGTFNYEPKKPFLLEMVSTDRVWRYSPTMPVDGRFVNPNGNHVKVSDPWLYYEKDIEWVWFLINHCAQVKSGKVYVDDFEKIAEDEARDIASDIDIKFALYSKNSPVSKDIDLLREVASVFGIEDYKRIGKLELKNALYKAISEGEKRGNKYVNYSKFEELTDSATKRRSAVVVRQALANDTIKWRSDERTWYSYAGGEFQTPLLKLKPTDISERENILMTEVLTNPTFKGKVYAELGIDDYQSRSEVRELGRGALFTLCEEEGIEVDKKSKLDEMVELYCNKKGIDKP